MAGYWYRAYGLRIHSEVRLMVPELAPMSEPQVTVRLGKIDSAPTTDGSAADIPKSLRVATPDEVCSTWDPVGTFRIRGGNEILVEPNPGITEKEVAPWVQGAALSLLMHQRGYLMLHASSVEIEDRAVAFLGHVGWGKSTTAAAMNARGHRLLADDVVAVRIEESGQPVMVPGFPHLKLMSGSVDFLGEDPAGMLEVTDDPTKRLRVSRDKLPDHPLPLAAVYILAEDETCGIDQLRPIVALPQILEHLFVARLTEFLRRTESMETHFKNCTRMIGGASICRLRRPKSFDLLPQVAEMIEQHAKSLAPVELQTQRA